MSADLNIKENYSLLKHNTLALEQSARYFVEVSSIDMLQSALNLAKDKNLPWLVIGEGSNLVLSQDFPGLVIHNQLKGIELLAESNQHALVKVAAGENWHQLVTYALQQGWHGLENLALIPGTAGAAPVQNIGAYGVELCDFFVELEAWDADEDEMVTLDSAQCQFEYRNSVFKKEAGRYIIVSVTLDLSKEPVLNTAYQSLAEYLQQKSESGEGGEVELLPQDVYDAVIAIRSSKLPDPVELPNAGSFFKNPIVSQSEYQQLLKQYSDLVSYPAGEGKQKLAAGWLIEKAGWKGRDCGNLAMHEQQALVLVNNVSASNASDPNAATLGKDVLHFAQQIQEDIHQRFGVALEIEPLVI